MRHDVRKDLIAQELEKGPWYVTKHNRSGLLQYELRNSKNKHTQKKARVMVGGKINKEGGHNWHMNRWSVEVPETDIEDIPRLIKFLEEIYPKAMDEKEKYIEQEMAKKAAIVAAEVKAKTAV